MTWQRDEDDMLDHESWRRALRQGGADTLLIWFRLRAWCARRLTDGVVPADMVDEVGEIVGKVKRRALQALVDATLLAWCDSDEDALRLCRGDDEPSPKPQRGSERAASEAQRGSERAASEARRLVVVGYLKRQPSRARVMAERDRRAQAEKLRRDRRGVTGHGPAHARARDSVDVPPRDNHPIPIPIPIPDHSKKSDREPERAAANRSDDSGLQTITTPAGVTKVVSLPKGPPPQRYIDEGLMRGIPLEQVISTWEHYASEGLPDQGVERPHAWLLHKAKERANRNWHGKYEKNQQPTPSKGRPAEEVIAEMERRRGKS